MRLLGCVTKCLSLINFVPFAMISPFGILLAWTIDSSFAFHFGEKPCSQYGKSWYIAMTLCLTKKISFWYEMKLIRMSNETTQFNKLWSS